jgi:hypothetical protein
VVSGNGIDRLRYWQRNWGCDCGASEMMRHRETCSVTPLFASVVRDVGLPINDTLWWW